jgi:hypothetical protein
LSGEYPWWLTSIPFELLKFGMGPYSFITEIESMFGKKVIQVIETGATGTISVSFRKYLSNIPGKHDIKELQKTAILGTAHILREVLM